jgi:Flp pilus assembly protein TadB
MTALAAVAGLLMLGGTALAVAGVCTHPLPAISAVVIGRRDVAGRVEAAGCALAAGLVVLVVTRWPVAAVGATIAGWWTPVWLRGRSRRDRQARTEAIALWAEMLRDAVGTARGIEGVLVATAATAPLPIRAEIHAMAERLGVESLTSALDSLGRDLVHPVGDLVVTALRLAATAGTREVRGVLDDLAAAAYAEAESQRRIDVARERPRAAMRYSALIIGVFVVGMVVFSGSYLAPYRSAVGQLVLLFVAAYWAAGFWWMQRMGRLAPVERFLAAAETTVVERGS